EATTAASTRIRHSIEPNDAESSHTGASVVVVEEGAVEVVAERNGPEVVVVEVDVVAVELVVVAEVLVVCVVEVVVVVVLEGGMVVVEVDDVVEHPTGFIPVHTPAWQVSVSVHGM